MGTKEGRGEERPEERRPSASAGAAHRSSRISAALTKRSPRKCRFKVRFNFRAIRGTQKPHFVQTDAGDGADDAHARCHRTNVHCCPSRCASLMRPIYSHVCPIVSTLQLVYSLRTFRFSITIPGISKPCRFKRKHS